MTKQEALKKIEELKNFIKQEDNEFVKIDYDVIPKELFEKYGCVPFEIQKKKMRKDGEVWNNINYFEAQEECKKLGCRLPNIREMLMLLEHYMNVQQEVSHNDKEFLGIEELSYGEEVYYEWIYNLDGVSYQRGGAWYAASSAGVFALNLDNSPADSDTDIGFRCARCK